MGLRYGWREGCFYPREGCGQEEQKGGMNRANGLDRIEKGLHAGQKDWTGLQDEQD
jgi:hypothetical protein